MLRRLYNNHVFANLIFVLVLAIGAYTYKNLPREEFPDVNFYWVQITTFAPGMAAEDVEQRITVVLERAVRNIEDISFATSFSRESISDMTVRFNSDISREDFDKHLATVRREIQNKRSELPDNINDPIVIEVDTSTAFNLGTIVISSEDDGINLLEQAQSIKKDLEGLRGMNLVIPTGLHERELQVRLDPQRLENQGISPTEVADTVSTYFRDISAGTNRVGSQAWAIKIDGMKADAEYVANLPILGRRNEVKIGDIATVLFDHEDPKNYVELDGKPAVLLTITKQTNTNSLDLMDRVKAYIEERNKSSNLSGVQLKLADDQSINTRKSVRIMERNALFGLLLVTLMTWIFLGPRIAIFTCIGIPFIVAGTFWIISLMGMTLNTIVLLGIVISLGMMVDDAVVVIESIYYRLQRGVSRMDAALDSLREVGAPVTTAVLTTIAAFMPLVLLEGPLGTFMSNVPIVVSIALAMSLVEAFWMLPIHIMGSNKGYDHDNKMNRWRRRWQRKLRNRYTRILVATLKRPYIIIVTCLVLISLAVGSSFLGVQYPHLHQHPIAKHFLIKFDFFKTDAYPVFYIGIEMPNGTPLEETMAATLELEKLLRPHLNPDELKATLTYSGKMEGDTAPLFGAQFGQILYTLAEDLPYERNAETISEEIRSIIENFEKAQRTSIFLVSMGPPTTKPISLKVTGDDINRVRTASDHIQRILASNNSIIGIIDDDSPGLQEMSISMNTDTINRSGLSPTYVARNIRMLVDGEIVATMQYKGEELEVRIMPDEDNLEEIDSILDQSINSPNGPVTIRSLTNVERGAGYNNIRRHNFRRAITIEADIDDTLTDTVNANRFIQDEWQKIQQQYPDIVINTEGQVDDIVESVNSLRTLFLFGVLLMYLIIGTQFQSYFQPLMIIVTVPLALIGVVVGQLISGNSVSLFTMIGVVALAGMAVNASIVMISAANDRLIKGMSVTHAAIYAGRRRVMPIVITNVTTVAGLFSLAAGIGGKSLMWGPLANAIVWGVMISGALTLLLIPVIYILFMPYSHLNRSGQVSSVEKAAQRLRRRLAEQ